MIIGLDFGNINSFPAYVSGIDERTRRGGVDVFLLPAQLSKTGIPSMFHYRKARHAAEQDAFSFGVPATRATPKANRRDTLKRRLWKSETFNNVVINYDDVITGMIKHIVDIANEELVRSGYPRCNKVSLSYPVIFTLKEKEHLKELAERAILSDGSKVEITGMIPEPAAAALEYLSTLPVTPTAKDYTVLVYDLGGGTFDAAVVTAHQDAEGIMTGYELLEQGGLPQAGNEFTNAMVDLMQRKLRELDIEINTNDAPMERFRMEAETLKCALSDINTNTVEYEDDEGNVVEITRSELEAATESLVTETIKTAKKVYNSCNVKPTLIIMTGGQSQMPVIRSRLQNEFFDIPKDNIIFHKPQQAIALGAARFGHLNCNTPSAVAPVVLRTSRMLGLSNVLNGVNDKQHVEVLIPKNTEIPMETPAKQLFHPNNPCFKHTIHLCEAINDNPDIYNDSHFVQVADLVIDFNISTPQKPTFEVNVYIDKNNKINFSARDPKGEFKTVSVKVEYTNGTGG